MQRDKPPSQSLDQSASLLDDDEKLSLPPGLALMMAHPQSSPSLGEEDVVYRSLVVRPLEPAGADLDPPSLLKKDNLSSNSVPVWQAGGWNVNLLQSGIAAAKAPRALANLAEQLRQVEAGIVPDLPTYFEKYTSFRSQNFPVKIFEQLAEGLKSLAVDFELVGARQQIQGSFYDEHNSAKFQINLFKAERGYLVEVQRRSGDSMAFNQLYQKLKKALLSSPSPIIDQAQGQPAPAAAAAMAARPPAYDVVLDQASLQPLKSMAESQYVDVAREGMKMLARCSSSADNHLLLANQCLDLLHSRLNSPDEELARYAAFILANLSKTVSVSEHLSSSSQVLEALFLILQRTESKEIRRQLAQTLNNLSLVRSSSFSPAQIEVLKPLKMTTDTRLSQLIENTLARCQVPM